MDMPPAPAPAHALRALSPQDIQRLCSGQSVVDLATAVKEMVENALDARATQITVQLDEYGKTGILVLDNGAGIAPRDFQTLARKHCTSKITQFEDLERVASFGFRGEALSSICQLAGAFSICTRTRQDDVGTALSFDSTGELINQTSQAHPVGTTVKVENLFQPLPVRCKDFHRNIKKHYARLLKVLQAYAVSCSNVKFQVSNTTSKHASRQVVLSTQGSVGMGDNLASIFGSKFFRSLVPVDFDLQASWPKQKHKPAASADADDDEEEKSSDVEEDEEFDAGLTQDEGLIATSETRRVIGFVSKVGQGVGRSDNDRQFFFINNRPFDLPKLAKAVNDAWRQFEMKQKPACVFNFLLPPGDFDVNVTPDKRSTFLKYEAHLVEAFKTQLVSLYEPSRSTFLVQPLLTSFTTDTTKSEDKVVSEAVGKVESLYADSASAEGINRHESSSFPDESHTPTEAVVSHTDSSGIADDVAEDVADLVLDSSARRSLSPSIHAHAAASSSLSEHSHVAHMPGCCAASKSSAPAATLDGDIQVRKKARLSSPIESSSTGPRIAGTGSARAHFGSTMSSWSLEELRRQRRVFFEQEVNAEQTRQNRHKRLHVPASATADAINSDSETAAIALQRVLNKDDFQRMEVVGQFNLGFIIGKLHDEDLFIIDQHASDEKFNYEQLQRTTVLHQQPLVHPLPLELTASEEMIITDHLSVFAQHGFKFVINKEAPPTKRLRLASVPFSKHTQFGVDDIRELASLLAEAPLSAATIKLPKLMAMFASRACRSSVMIGTALHKEEMVKIVRNLATLEQPWNCPHGRPTLRHLADLQELDNEAS